MRFRQGPVQGLDREFSAIADARDAPDWLRASALLQLGRAHDASGRRDAARAAYQRVIDDFENESAAWPARVGLVTPINGGALLQAQRGRRIHARRAPGRDEIRQRRRAQQHRDGCRPRDRIEGADAVQA